MLLRLFPFLLLSIGLLSCSSSEKRTNPEIKKILLSEEIALLDLAVDLQREVAKEIWPGFFDFTTSVVYFTNDGQFLINPKGALPSEYRPTSSKGPSWSPEIYTTEDWFAPDGSIFSHQEINTAYLANAFSSHQTNNHFEYSVFFLDSIGRFHFKGMSWNVDDWLSIFWHEVFHNYQDSLYKPELITNEVTDFSNIETFVQSEKFLGEIRKELKILNLALKANDAKKKRVLVCNKLIPMKIKRYKSMPLKAVTSEQFYEISEGTARYIEERMSLAAGKLLISKETQNQYLLSNFQFFKKYASRNLSYYFDSIQNVSPQKRYFYNTGFGLALLLDQIQPRWKDTAFQEKGFLFTQIKTWCAQ